MPIILEIEGKDMSERGVKKLDISNIFRVAKSGKVFYLNVTKIAKLFNLKEGDKLRVEIKEKILDTYRD